MKRLLPNSISFRFTLIILLPILLIQAVSIYFFVRRHFSAISETMSFSIISQINHVINTYETHGMPMVEQESDLYQFKVREIKTFPHRSTHNNMATKTLRHFIKKHLSKPYIISFQEPNILVYVKTKNAPLQFAIPKKNIFSSTNLVFLILIIVAPLILFAIAQIFLKNQLRPIIHLSKIIKTFDQFASQPVFMSPSGSSEIKTLIESFNQMITQIHRFLNERTLMLAGVSHDLKTYLTRLKLQIALINEKEAKKILPDIQLMESTLDEFLEFSKNQYLNINKKKFPLIHFLENLIQQLKKSYSLKIKIVANHEIPVYLNEKAITRCILNIIDNSSRFAKVLQIQAESNGGFLVLTFDDDGPGIPDEHIADALTPFYKLSAAHGQNHTSLGLGLSVITSVIKNMNGHLELGRSEKLSGLKITIKLPQIFSA